MRYLDKLDCSGLFSRRERRNQGFPETVRKMSPKPDNIKLITSNRKARYQYHLLLVVEAGIVLTGTEVKSLRDGIASLEEAYAVFSGEEIFVVNLHIPEYTHGNRMNHDPNRRRKLLLHESEILKLQAKVKEKGLTLIPTKLYFKKGWAKIEIALAKGKRLYDKRQDMKKRDAKKEIDRAYSSKSRE